MTALTWNWLTDYQTGRYKKYSAFSDPNVLGERSSAPLWSSKCHRNPLSLQCSRQTRLRVLQLQEFPGSKCRALSLSLSGLTATLGALVLVRIADWGQTTMSSSAAAAAASLYTKIPIPALFCYTPSGFLACTSTSSSPSFSTSISESWKRAFAISVTNGEGKECGTSRRIGSCQRSSK